MRYKRTGPMSFEVEAIGAKQSLILFFAVWTVRIAVAALIVWLFHVLPAHATTHPDKPVQETSCAEKHLHRYLAEFDFRYNRRIALGIDDSARAVDLWGVSLNFQQKSCFAPVITA